MDTPPSFPIFANKTTKSAKNISQPSSFQESTSQHTFFQYLITMYPYSAIPPFGFPSQVNLPPQSSQIIQTSGSNKSIPKIEEFLQNLNNEYRNGKFTCFLNNFLNESIDVLDILELNDSDFIKLGINCIGI